MPNFKPKSSKKFIINKGSNNSLDNKHENILNDFNKEEKDDIPELLEKRKKLIQEFNEEEATFDEKLEIKIMVKEIDAKINKIRKNKKLYFLNNSKYIFDYFQTKKEISEGNSNIKLLDSFFNINVTDVSFNENNSKISIQKYFNNVDNYILDINNFIKSNDICRLCNKGELIPIDHEGILVCNKCFKNTKFLVENDKPSYKDPPKGSVLLCI